MAFFKKTIGKTKEEFGKITDNPEMELSGKVQRLKEESKETIVRKKNETVENLKDKADSIKEKATEKKDDSLRKVNNKIDNITK